MEGLIFGILRYFNRYTICAKMNNSPPAKHKQVVLVSRTTRQLPPLISQLIGRSIDRSILISQLVERSIQSLRRRSIKNQSIGSFYLVSLTKSFLYTKHH